MTSATPKIAPFLRKRSKVMCPRDSHTPSSGRLQSHWTKAFRGFGFRMRSRPGCVVHQLVESREQQYPWKLLQLLDDPQLAADLEAVPECCLDNFTRRFRQQCMDQGCSCPDAVASNLLASAQPESGRGRARSQGRRSSADA